GRQRCSQPGENWNWKAQTVVEPRFGNREEISAGESARCREDIRGKEHRVLIDTELRKIVKIIIIKEVYIDIVNEEWACGIVGFRDPDEQTLHCCRLWEGVSGYDPTLPSWIKDHAWIE